MEELTNKLDEAARRALREMLAQCTGDQQLVFKHMYAAGNLEKSLYDVVSAMSFDKLDSAMAQVGNIIEKNRAKT